MNFFEISRTPKASQKKTKATHLDLRSALSICYDLSRSNGKVLVFQDFKTSLGCEKLVHGFDLTNALELQELLDVKRHRVLQHIDELAILSSHLFRIHDLRTRR